MMIISYFLIFNIFYSVNISHRYVILVSKRQLKVLSILFQLTMMYFSAESSPAVKYLTIMKLPFENYFFMASFAVEGRFLKFVLTMITKMPEVNQAFMLYAAVQPFALGFRISQFHSYYISMH